MDFEIETLFNYLIKGLNDYLDSIHLLCKEELEKYNYDKADILLQKIKEVKEFIEKIQKLSQDWDKIKNNIAFKNFIKDSTNNDIKNKRKKIDRTPESEFYIPILLTLKELGGKAKVNKIIPKVYEKIKGKLKEDDFKNIESKDEPRWENTSKWARKKLVDMGFLSSESDYGSWEITELGLKFLKDNNNDVKQNI